MKILFLLFCLGNVYTKILRSQQYFINKGRILAPGVKVGMSKKKYKKIPPNKLKPLNIHFKIPIKYAEPKDQSPIVVVPQIVMPRKKKRIVVHHTATMGQYYKQMVNTMNPYYLMMFKQNPYYDFIYKNPVFLNYEQEFAKYGSNDVRPHFNFISST